MREFEPGQLVALRALLEEANVTRAGQRINVGQSSMSASLAKLREHFQDELLVRLGRDYELTPFGRELLPQVQRALAEIERAFTAGSSFDPATTPRSFTFLCPDFAAIEVRDLLLPVAESYPCLSFEYFPLPDQPTEPGADLLAVDFIVAALGEGPEGEYLKILADRYVCLVDQGNPAVENGRLSWEAFAALPIAASHVGRGNFLTPIDRRLKEMGLYQEPMVKVNGLLALPMMVSGTNMVALVPSRLAERMGPGTGTIGVEPPFREIGVTEGLWWHASRAEDPSHRWLRAQIANLASLPAGLTEES